ncbi:hypothetical protein [Flavobacterium sp. W21_SRS_FM6]
MLKKYFTKTTRKSPQKNQVPVVHYNWFARFESQPSDNQGNITNHPPATS